MPVMSIADYCRANGMVSSMSRSGNCLDNAVAERFFRTLKTECLLNWRNMTAEEVKHDIVDYIEMFYNSERLHSLTGISVQMIMKNG